MEDVQDEGRHYAIEQVRAEEKRRVVGGVPSSAILPFHLIKIFITEGLIRLRLAAEWNIPDAAGRLAAEWNIPVAAGRLPAKWNTPIAAERLAAKWWRSV